MKIVGLYVDKANNLLAIPHGESIKYELAELDIVLTLRFPYSDENIESFLLESIAKCYNQKVDDDTDTSPLEKFLNVKGYSKAVKNRRLVILQWFKDKGYAIVPTNKIPKRGFVHMEDKTFELGKQPQKGALAKAFREAMELSTTY